MLQAIKLLASLTQYTQNFVSTYPTSTRPSPHQRLTWHRSPRGRQAQVVPTPEAPIPAAPPRGAQGGVRRLLKFY
jgi:hypothetical protein